MLLGFAGRGLLDKCMYGGKVWGLEFFFVGLKG